MSRLLAIDPSHHLGWCHGVPGQKGVFGVHPLPQGAKFTTRMKSLRQFLVSLIKGNGITEVVIEKPILPRVTSFDAVYSLVGIVVTIGNLADDCGCSVTLVDQQKWRSGFMGVTQAPKMNDAAVMAILVDVRNNAAVAKFHEAMADEKKKTARRRDARRRWLKNHTMETCRRVGYPVTDDNEADAIGLFEFVCRSRARRAAAPELDLTAGLLV